MDTQHTPVMRMERKSHRLVKLERWQYPQVPHKLCRKGREAGVRVSPLPLEAGAGEGYVFFSV